MSRTLVIIPAYNEEETIAQVIENVRRDAPGCDVLVVDDGSSDGTPDVVTNTGGAALVRLPFNLGIGGAMQTGYRYALRNGYDIAVQCDADGQHPPRRIPDLVRHVEEGAADLLIGSRYVADTAYAPSLTRRIGKSLMSRLVDTLIGGGITDTTSGFRAANRKVIALFAKDYPDDYPEAEALIMLYKNGLKAAEMPVDMLPRQGGRTSIRPRHAVYYMVKVGLAILVHMLRKGGAA
ncbi:MAG TPA: glycosyltransferase family 2 protein [Candidatus Hydrogenedentes bacterium]|nr:glycosyltransferase family 2 protein [Candidatus Hydrogenedentota bacterium]HPC16290.1 glycosyltransferase family 2 protein [Candidatus Hydrogenedentota bacterium]HRT20792.1 glycosyltransferase family 2 protein [Candidatus Hydrogenedentota bacterium]HRT66261.1 glycosyltransferase family 2 protein [Candidatus Hydrogenedentota bacterium]